MSTNALNSFGSPWVLGLLGLVVLAGLAELASRRLRRGGAWAPAGVGSALTVATALVAGRVAYLRAGAGEFPIWNGGLSLIWALVFAGGATAIWTLRGTRAFRPLVVVAAVGAITGLPGLWKPPIGDGATLDGLVLSDLAGEPMALEDRAGRPLVMNLWASWCGPCRAEMPMMQHVDRDQADVDFVFVNQGEALVAIGTYLATEGLSGESVALDPDRVTARRYGGIGLPTTVFFDAAGKLQSIYVGEMTEATLMERIDLIRGR
jgi:thiol-disulfide isomerase/thioredoxin